MNVPKIFQRQAILVTALLLTAFAFGYFANQKSQTSPEAKSYSVGEIAKEQVVAPKKIVVVDPAETQVRRQAEAEKIPLVFRFQKTVSDQAVARFSTEFVFTRENFLDSVEKNFKMRTLTTNQVESPRFRKLLNTFQTGNKSYPVNLRDAKTWAQGDLEEDFLKQLCAKLRNTTERSIRPDSVPLENGPLTFQIRVYSGDEVSPALEALKQKGQLVRRTNFVSVTKARADLLSSFPRDQRAIGKFLTNFVEPNYIFDSELTQRVRAEKTNTVWAVNSYEAGHVIVKKGERIDAKIKAALDELKIQTPVIASAGRLKPIWLWSAALACAILALIVWLLGFAFRSRAVMVPANNVLVLPQSEYLDGDLRARLIPHLARSLMSKFVRALISQRSDLMRTQNAGTEQLAELEQRLDQINTRLQNRQAVYERRIAELEKELAAAEEENRELIRAKIHEARQNLEWAKTQANGN